MSVPLLAFFTGGWEWIIIILVILLLFGASRIPKLARGLGEGVSEFKKGLNQDDLSEDLEEEDEKKIHASEQNTAEEQNE